MSKISENIQQNIIINYNDGLSLAQTAKNNLVGINSVRKIVKAHGLTIRNHARFLLQSKEKDILKLYQDGNSVNQITKLFKVNEYSVMDILKKNNIEIKEFRLSEKTVKLITKEYKDGLSCRKIAIKYGYNHHTIALHLNNVGLKLDKHKYQINEHCLDELNKNTAYFLGYLMADGCVLNNNKICIALHEKDKHILEEFSKILSSENLVKQNKKKNQYYISFKNKYFGEKLKYWGCGPRKSLTLEYIATLKQELDNKNLFSHFLRGMIDGDGCIHFNKKTKKTSIGLIGSHSFIKSIKVELLSKLNILTYINSAGNGNISCLTITKQQNIYKLLMFLYQDAEFRLNRKYLKYLDLKEHLEIRLTKRRIKF